MEENEKILLENKAFVKAVFLICLFSLILSFYVILAYDDAEQKMAADCMLMLHASL